MGTVLYGVRDTALPSRKGRESVIFFTAGALKKLPFFNRLNRSLHSLETATPVADPIVRYAWSRFSLIPTKQLVKVRILWFFEWEAVLHGFRVMDRNLNKCWSVVSDGEEFSPLLLSDWPSDPIL